LQELNSIKGEHNVIISTDNDLENVNSVIFDSVASKPGSANTIWICSADGHLIHGSTDTEDFVAGLGLLTDNAIVCWNSTTGTSIQNSTVRI
jgi:hypothetical protein